MYTSRVLIIYVIYTVNTTIICYSIKLNMFYWLYAWSTMYLSNVSVYIGSYRVEYVVHIYMYAIMLA